jgi:hypothetical protein
MTEVFNNYGPITLALACGISDPTITVTNATALSATGNYRLLIDDEIMLATSRSGSVVSVTRAQEDTTAAAHSLSIPVVPIVSAGALNQLKADIESSGAALAGYTLQANGSGGSAYAPLNLALGTATTGILPFVSGGRIQGMVSVVTGTPTTLNETDEIANCQTTGGTTVVNLYAAAATELRALVFDDNNNAATNNITVNGNGHNLEDPNNAGTFSSSVVIKTNSQSICWMFDGTVWKIIWSNGGGSAGFGVLLVTHSSPGTFTSSYAHASCATTGGTISVTAPTVATLPSSGLGWRIYVSDDGGSAITNPITVSGGGINIEDPQNPGTFSSSVTIQQNWSSWGWYYNGTHWKLFAFDAQLPYRLGVTNSTPGTLTGTLQIALADTSTGTCAVALCASPTHGYINSVIDRGGQANLSPITVTAAGGLSLEDPNNPGTFSTSVVLHFNGTGVTWTWDSAKNHWKLDYVFYQSANGILAVTNSSPGTLNSAYRGATANSSTGTTVVTAPLVSLLPNGGAGWQFGVVDIGGAASTSAVTISGNGQNIEQPQAPGTFASSVTLTSNYGGVIWEYTGSEWKVASTSFGNAIRFATRPLLASVASTPNGPTNELAVGYLLFKPSDEVAGYKVYLRVILETTGASYQANIALYDVNNVLGNGAGAVIPGSTLTTISTTAVELEVELNTVGGNLETLTSNILIYAGIWLTTVMAGQTVTCSHAALYVKG